MEETPHVRLFTKKPPKSSPPSVSSVPSCSKLGAAFSADPPEAQRPISDLLRSSAPLHGASMLDARLKRTPLPPQAASKGRWHPSAIRVQSGQIRPNQAKSGQIRPNQTRLNHQAPRCAEISSKLSTITTIPAPPRPQPPRAYRENRHHRFRQIGRKIHLSLPVGILTLTALKPVS